LFSLKLIAQSLCQTAFKLLFLYKNQLVKYDNYYFKSMCMRLSGYVLYGNSCLDSQFAKFPLQYANNDYSKIPKIIKIQLILLF